MTSISRYLVFDGSNLNIEGSESKEGRTKSLRQQQTREIALHVILLHKIYAVYQVRGIAGTIGTSGSEQAKPGIPRRRYSLQDSAIHCVKALYLKVN